MVFCLLMISGLQKQRQLLTGLIEEIEKKPVLDTPDLDFCERRTNSIADNLKKLRKIKKGYHSHFNEASRN